MKCEDIKELISEYIDGMAENPDEIKQHIDSCGECHRYFEEIRRTKNLCNSVAMTPLPSGFKERLDKKLKNIERIPWYKNRKMYISAAGLAACLVIAVGPVYQTYEDISVDTKKTETASISGISEPLTEESNNMGTVPRTVEENKKSEITEKSTTADYSQDISEEKAEKEVTADMTEKAGEADAQSSDLSDFANEPTVPQETLASEPVSAVAVSEEKHLQTPAYSPEESEDAYNIPASEYAENEILAEQSTEEITDSVSTKRSGGGGGSSAAVSSSSAEKSEALSQIYVFPSELKVWFDENIGSMKTIKYDGEEIYIISEFDLAMLMAEADAHNTDYSSINSDLPSGYYVSFYPLD